MENKRYSLTVETNKKNILLKFGEEYRDYLWAKTFGKLQKIIKESQSRNLIVDLSSCKWIDPGPLLNIALLIEEWRYRSKYTQIIIPDYNKVKKNQQSFIGFLTKEKFLDCFLGCDDFEIPEDVDLFLGSLDHKITPYYFSFYKKAIEPLSAFAAYQNATFIPAKIIHNISQKNIDDIVNDLIERAKSYNFKSQFASIDGVQSYGSDTNPSLILQEVRQVVFELIKNVKEHAFLDENAGAINAGLYGRIRYGYSDGRKLDHKDQLLKYYSREDLACPQLEYSDQLKHVGFVELFVSDFGKGVTLDYQTIRKKQGKHNLKSFFISMPTQDAFSRFTEKERLDNFKSPMPGLKYVSDLLKNRNGFMRILEGEEWCGASFPFEQNRRSDLSISVSLASDNSPIEGSHYCIRISLGTPFELPDNWDSVSYDNYKNSRNSVIFRAYNEISNPPDSWRKIAFEVRDDQEKDIILNGQAKKITHFEIGMVGRAQQKIVWRPEKTILRDEIPKQLIELSHGKKNVHIIIIDQDLAAAIMTHWSLVKSKAKRYPNIKQISIISNTLCAADIIKRGNLFISVEPDLQKENNTATIHMGHIVWMLKEIDSRIFWNEIISNNDNCQYLVNENILWEEDKRNKRKLSIEKYVDFTNTLNNRRCRWVYKRALGRFLSYLSPKKSPYPVDHIVEAFVSNFYYQNNFYFYKKKHGTISKSRPIILLGSIVVSGNTSKAIEAEWLPSQIRRNPIVTHFLPHYQGIDVNRDLDRSAWLLNWNWIKENESQANNFKIKRPPYSQPLRRIIDSPMIGFGGNKHWTLVRMYFDNNDKEKKNIYGCSPSNPNGYSTSEVYTYWQTNNLLKFGHWISSNHHDCIGLDLMEALKLDSIPKQGPIWTFIISHLQRLNPNYDHGQEFAKCQLLATVVNEETMYIVSELANNFQWLREKVIMLPYVQRRRKSMRLRVGSLEEQRLKEKIENVKSKTSTVNVLLFDTVISSSRTFRELRNLIKACGADEVYSFSLIDRTRLPNQVEIFPKLNKFRDARLWRYDLDFLSPSENYNYSSGCPICGCEQNLDSILSKKLTERVSNRLKVWKQVIKLERLSSSSFLNGIQKERLEKPIDLSIGIDKNRKDKIPTIKYNDKITLEESTALAALVSEIVTITGEHDLVATLVNALEKKIRDKPGLYSRESIYKIVIELLASQLVYLRNDIVYKRKLSLSKKLLIAIYRSPKENSATAFACSLILGLDKSLLIHLGGLVAELFETMYSVSNFDFNLISSYLLANTDKNKLNLFISEKPYLQSFIPLMESIDLRFPYSLIDIIQLIGIRDGVSHRTMLAEALFNHRQQIENYQVVCSIIQRLKLLFQKLIQEKHGFTSFTSDELLVECARRLKNVYRRLLYRKRKGLNPQLVSEIYDYLQALFYGGRLKDKIIYQYGIKGCVKQSFIKGINQIKPYLQKLISKNETIKDANIYIDYKRYYNDRHNQKIIAIFTKDIERCLIEYFDNAYKYKELNDDDEYCFEILIGNEANSFNEDSITINIKNRKKPDFKVPSVYSANQHSLELMGGRIEPILENNHYHEVIIILPTPNSTVFR